MEVSKVIDRFIQRILEEKNDFATAYLALTKSKITEIIARNVETASALLDQIASSLRDRETDADTLRTIIQLTAASMARDWASSIAKPMRKWVKAVGGVMPLKEWTVIFIYALLPLVEKLRAPTFDVTKASHYFRLDADVEDLLGDSKPQEGKDDGNGDGEAAEEEVVAEEEPTEEESEEEEPAAKPKPKNPKRKPKPVSHEEKETDEGGAGGDGGEGDEEGGYSFEDPSHWKTLPELGNEGEDFNDEWSDPEEDFQSLIDELGADEMESPEELKALEGGLVDALKTTNVTPLDIEQAVNIFERADVLRFIVRQGCRYDATCIGRAEDEVRVRIAKMNVLAGNDESIAYVTSLAIATAESVGNVITGTELFRRLAEPLGERAFRRLQSELAVSLAMMILRRHQAKPQRSDIRRLVNERFAY